MKLIEIKEYAENSNNKDLLKLTKTALEFWSEQSDATFSKCKKDVKNYMDVKKSGKYYLAIILA